MVKLTPAQKTAAIVVPVVFVVVVITIVLAVVLTKSVVLSSSSFTTFTSSESSATSIVPEDTFVLFSFTANFSGVSAGPEPHSLMGQFYSALGLVFLTLPSMLLGSAQGTIISAPPNSLPISIKPVNDQLYPIIVNSGSDLPFNQAFGVLTIGADGSLKISSSILNDTTVFASGSAGVYPRPQTFAYTVFSIGIPSPGGFQMPFTGAFNDVIPAKITALDPSFGFLSLMSTFLPTVANQNLRSTVIPSAMIVDSTIQNQSTLAPMLRQSATNSFSPTLGLDVSFPSPEFTIFGNLNFDPFMGVAGVASQTLCFGTSVTSFTSIPCSVSGPFGVGVTVPYTLFFLRLGDIVFVSFATFFLMLASISSIFTIVPTSPIPETFLPMQPKSTNMLVLRDTGLLQLGTFQVTSSPFMITITNGPRLNDRFLVSFSVGFIQQTLFYRVGVV